MSKDNYLPAVDGLRAVAVLAVIANHMMIAVLPGGYLGVDIFFVISGFVITQSLLSRQNMSAGQLMLDFYARRMKRLLPVLVLVAIVGSLLIRLFDPKPITSTVTGALSLIGLSNIFLFNEAIDYFGGSAALNIFTHMWSLGVEEQFYFAYPLLFCLTANVSFAIRLGALAALSMASVIAFAFVAKFNQPAAYFLTPFRFWELGLGCLASLAIAQKPEYLALMRRLPASLPFVAMLIGLAMPDDWFMEAALLTAASTAISLLTLSDGSLPYRLLSSSAIVYIGRISYSLYLWHWLVICLSVWTIGIHWWSTPLQIIIIFAVAALLPIPRGAAALRAVIGQRLENGSGRKCADHFGCYSDRSGSSLQSYTIRRLEHAGLDEPTALTRLHCDSQRSSY
jgi:peptidoglycan/LPS O-acetylase OafA/YrhL